MAMKHLRYVTLVLLAAGCADEPGEAELGVQFESVQEGGRSYILRDDGTKIPLLTPGEVSEMRANVTGAVELPRLFDAPPPSVDLSGSQTPVKNQMDRGSCGTFATVAAIEAAYKRTYGLTLDLSEQYAFHVAKSTGWNYPKLYKYENQSSYWYGGGWPQTTYLYPTEALAPYAGYTACPTSAPCTPLDSIPGTPLVWHDLAAMNPTTQQQVDDFEYSPLHIPPAARNNAIYGVASFSDYGDADARNTSLLESLLASNKEVVLASVLHWRMLPSGILDFDATRNDGAHVFLLIGYNRAEQYFLVKNSWGGTAPTAYLKVSYNFIRNAAYAAATVNAVVSPYGAPQAKAKWIGKWNQDHEGWYGSLVVRRITPVTNASERLGTHYLYGSYANGHSVNGYSIDGNAGIRMYVASETENAPGTLTGQRFDIDQYAATPEHAAGTTWWDTTGEGGVRLGRSAFGMPYSNTFSTSEWLGTWDVNTNGTPAVLYITGITTTAGDYTVTASLALGGIWHTITGTIERSRPTIAHFLVDGVSNYTLHYHFWEDKLASGNVTRSGYTRTGVHAVRR